MINTASGSVGKPEARYHSTDVQRPMLAEEIQDREIQNRDEDEGDNSSEETDKWIELHCTWPPVSRLGSATAERIVATATSTMRFGRDFKHVCPPEDWAKFGIPEAMAWLYEDWTLEDQFTKSTSVTVATLDTESKAAAVRAKMEHKVYQDWLLDGEQSAPDTTYYLSLPEALELWNVWRPREFMRRFERCMRRKDDQEFDRGVRYGEQIARRFRRRLTPVNARERYARACAVYDAGFDIPTPD